MQIFIYFYKMDGIKMISGDWRYITYCIIVVKNVWFMKCIQMINTLRIEYTLVSFNFYKENILFWINGFLPSFA